MTKAEKIGTILIGGLIAITLFSTLVAKNSQTPAVINSSGSALSSTLNAARGGN